MLSTDLSANAVILRNVVDDSIKSNQFLITNLSHVMPDLVNTPECFQNAGSAIELLEAINLIGRNKKPKNIDVAYMILLAIRGFKFYKVAEKVYLCENGALDPAVDKIPLSKSLKKPKLGNTLEIKTAILKTVIESANKNSESIIRNLIKNVPDFIERHEHINYAGRYLTITEWIVEKEAIGTWTSNEVFKAKNNNYMPWTFGNLIVLQTRGYFLQEVPAFKTNEYVFTSKE